MSDSNENAGRHDAVEALLEHAVPRPIPPVADERRVRDSVYSEWQTITAGHRSRRRRFGFAIAASVAVAVGFAFDMLLDDAVAPLEVASIDVSYGTVYVLGDESRLDPIGDREALLAGQAIETAAGAGIGLKWIDGGSLRVDSDSRIEFVSEAVVRLIRGRVYFDSRGAATELAVDTRHGFVRPVGTQYMAAADLDTLWVSVREGEVRIDGVIYDESVGAGYRVQVTGSARPAKMNFPVYGNAWLWAESLSPATALDGETIHEFLLWVCRETGLELEYVGNAEAVARGHRFVGSVDRPPREELRLRMPTADLAYSIDGGTLKVFTGNATSRP